MAEATTWLAVRCSTEELRAPEHPVMLTTGRHEILLSVTHFGGPRPDVGPAVNNDL
jgi:hypothetical protein